MENESFTIPVMPPFMEQPKRDYPISQRENFLRVFRSEKPMWMPAIYQDTQWIFPSCYNDIPLDNTRDGVDWFGTKYKYMPANDGHTPVPGLFNEVGEWREKVKWPDLHKLDWAADLPNFVRDKNLVQAARLGNGIFERLHMSEGFEQALCDIYEEPEECKAYFDRQSEFKIELFNCINDVYHVDYACSNDDWANAKAQFFSEDIFETELLDASVALADAVHKAGCGYMVHCCGKMEVWLPYIVDDLHASIMEIQTINDLKMVLEKYGDRTSPIFSPDPYVMYNPKTTPEQAREYARYIVDNYGAQTCKGSGALIYLIGNIPEIYYPFVDEIYNYSLKVYKDLQ